MPRPMRICARPGCPELTAGQRLCEGHRKGEARAVDAARPKRSARGVIGAAWKALRLRVLLRDPLCVVCRRAPSQVADHIIPRSQGGSDALENLRGVCRRCNAIDTARFDGAFGNRIRRGKVVR